MIYMTVILFFTLLLNSLIVYLVYKSNPKRLSNRIFSFLGINISLWNLAFIFIINSTTSQMALSWIRTTFVLGSFVPLCFVALTFSVGEKSLDLKKRRSFVPMVLLVAFSIIFSLMPNLFLDISASGETMHQVPHATYGWPFYAFFVLFFSGNIFGFHILLRKMRMKRGIARAELEYIIAGELFALFFVFFCNFLYPVLFKSSFLVQFSPIGVLVMNGIIGYGIAKYRILDISVVMEKTLSYCGVMLFIFMLYFISSSFFGFFLSRHVAARSVLPEAFALVAVILAFDPSRRLIRNFVRKKIFRLEYIPEDLIAGLEKVLYTVGDVKEFLKICFRIILKEMEISKGMVVFMKSDRQEVDFCSGYSCDESTGIPDNDPVLDYPSALAEYAKRTRGMVSREDLERRIPLPEYTQIIDTLDSLDMKVAMPLFEDKELFGILFFGEKLSGRFYTREDETIFDRLSSYISIKVRNFLLYEQIERVRAYQDSLLENLPSGVIGINQNREITIANREFERISGLSGKEIEKRRFEEVLPPEIVDILSYTLKNGKGVENLQFTLPAAGSELSLIANSAIFFDRRGHLFGVQAILSDVTRVKDLEESVRRADRLASLGIMAAGIAHEIKNPLVSIKTFVQLIPDKHNDREFRETFSGLTLKEVDRINNLIEQILLFSKPRAAVVTDVELVSLLKSTLLLISSQVKERGIRIVERYPQKDIVIRGDEEKLKQAFLNVLMNGIEADDYGGLIDLGVEKYNNIVNISVKDNGCGMEKEIIGKIFEPFFTTKEKGTGLGLATVARIIEEHGGRISVSSVAGQGTTVSIDIPLATQRSHDEPSTLDNR